jgi:hypothetical protein
MSKPSIARSSTRITRRPRAAGLIGAAAAALVAIGAASAQQRLQEPPQPRQSVRTEAPATEVSRTPYQAYLAADCLAGSNFCKFASDVVLGRRRLEIHRVSCQGWHASDTPPNFVVIAELRTDADVFIGRIDFLETTYTRVGTNTVWQISEPVLMFIPARHRLRIMLNSASTGVGSYGCTISGYLVTLEPSL